MASTEQGITGQSRKKSNWLAIGSALAALALVVAMFAFVILPYTHEAKFKPQGRDRLRAESALMNFIGEDAKQIVVPAVNLDIGLIYVTVPISERSRALVKENGTLRTDMPGEVYDMTGPRDRIMIDFKTNPSKVMVGRHADTHNGKRCVERYRQWLEGAKLPWP